MNRPYPDKRANRVWEEPAMSLADATVVATQSSARALQDLSSCEIAARIAARELASARSRQWQAQCRHRRSIGKRAQGR